MNKQRNKATCSNYNMYIVNVTLKLIQHNTIHAQKQQFAQGRMDSN